MIRQDFCPKCQQVTNQKTTKTLQASVTKCEQCSTTLKLEYTPRKPSQSVKARKMTKPVKISFMSTRKIVDGKKVKTKPQRVSFIAKVSPKQSKRNRELAKIEPPENNLCENCGQKADWRGLAKHHLVYKSQGGKDNRENLLWCCGKCHHAFHGIIEQSK